MLKELKKKVKDIESEIKIRRDNYRHFSSRQDYEGMNLMKQAMDAFQKQLDEAVIHLNNYNLAREKGMSKKESELLIKVIKDNKLPFSNVVFEYNVHANKFISVKLDNVFFHAANLNDPLFKYVMDWIQPNYLDKTV